MLSRQYTGRDCTPGHIIDIAMDLADEGRARAADALLTAAAFAKPSDERLWLAAGLVRLRRGSVRAAVSALQMAVWLSGDPFAEDLLQAIGYSQRHSIRSQRPRCAA